MSLLCQIACKITAKPFNTPEQQQQVWRVWWQKPVTTRLGRRHHQDLAARAQHDVFMQEMWSSNQRSTILYSHCCSASGWEIIKFTTIFHVFSVFIQLMSVIINSFNHKCAVWSSLPLNYFMWTWKLTRPMRKFIDNHKSGLQRCLWWRHLSSMVF